MYEELAPLEGIKSPMLSEFWDWVKRTFTADYRLEIERYLGESADVYELENRIKLLQRRGVI
ncbi:MAG: hypothetical protein ACO294_05290 [Methylococcales bacterium]